MSFVTRCAILQEGAIGGWVNCSQKGTDVVGSNTQGGCGVYIMDRS